MMYLNGNHISNYSQPIHFHYPINRRLGSRVASDSTISSSLIIDRPSRVRVSLYESGRPASIVSPETPEPLSTFNSINNNNNHNNNNINCCTTISRIINPPLSSSSVTSNYTNHHQHQQQQSISHSTLSSTTVNHPHHNQDHHQLTLDLVKMMERKISVDSGFENPFRPGGELSREAETIVNLIKEGKPITPTTPTKELTSGDSSSSSPSSKILNGISSNNQSPNEQLSPSNSDKLPKITNSGSTTTTINKLNEMKQSTKTNGDSSKIYPESNDANLNSNKLNGSSKLMLNHKTSNGAGGGPNSPGIGQNERSTVTPSEQLKDENKKNKKCICCVVQ